MSVSDLREAKECIEYIINDQRSPSADNYSVFESDWYYMSICYESKNECVSTLFIDLRKPDSFFKQSRDTILRIMRAYLNSLLRLIKDYDYSDKLIYDIGVRKSGVYVIYQTPKKDNINNVFNVACHIYSFHLMFQKIMRKKGFKSFDIGIGLATNIDIPFANRTKDYVNVYVMDYLLGGRAVSDAARLASYGNRNGMYTFVTNHSFFYNLNDANKKHFSRLTDFTGNYIYHCNCWFTNEKKWVEDNL